jgi:hypothetical protein
MGGGGTEEGSGGGGGGGGGYRILNQFESSHGRIQGLKALGRAPLIENWQGWGLHALQLSQMVMGEHDLPDAARAFGRRGRCVEQLEQLHHMLGVSNQKSFDIIEIHSSDRPTASACKNGELDVDPDFSNPMK